MADDDPPSSQTLQDSSPAPASNSTLDLSGLPPIFVSATHFETDDLHEYEEGLVNAGATLTYDIKEARIVLSKASRKPRIQFDLRAKGLWTEEVVLPEDSTTQDDDVPASLPPTKKRKLEQCESLGKDESQAIVIDDESTASEDEGDARAKPERAAPLLRKGLKESTAPAVRDASLNTASEGFIRVIKVDWFDQSKAAGYALPLNAFTTFQGRQIEKPAGEATPQPGTQIKHSKPITATTYTATAKKPGDDNILERAREDAPKATSHFDRFGKRRFNHHASTTTGASWEAGQGKNNSQYAHLLQQSTTEHDDGQSSDLPEMPEWVKQGVKYACQRLTPKDSLNETFISLLKQIKLARLLTNDEIGVRAYSTSIASLAAYPYKVITPREIMALPGCDAKIANIFVEWVNTGKIQAVEDIEADEDLRVLRLFYEIWGVGATTARDFYYDRGWRDLDDIVEFGWSTLSRVQQIGVKYYDEFLDPIPRAEVAQIADVIHRHAVKVRDDKVQSMIVGGYRRGKEACGDVDMIVSHPDESQTLNIVNDIVASLEEEGWITHTLLLSLTSTNRGQQTLAFRTGGGGHGFDTLDKALVVWQDPHWPTQEADLAANPKAKNPNIHRRVDIIISTWRTVGCAVAGWSGGTTFQRDLRRYAKNVKGWKFDSSGVRDRGNGEVVDLEGFYKKGVGGRAKTMEEAERRVFEGMGLVFREPWERCTG